MATRFAYSNTYALTSPVVDPALASSYYQAAPLSEYRSFVDAETLRLAFDLSWRIDDRWQIGMELPLFVQSGGFLDSVVEGFHGLFGLTNGGREQFPRNGYGVYVAKDGQFWLEKNRSPQPRWGDIVFRLKSPLFEGGGRWPSVSALTAVKLPTGHIKNLTGSGGTDFQLALIVSYQPSDNLVLHYNWARTKLGSTDQSAQFPMRAAVYSNMFALEFMATERLSIITQVLSNTSPFPRGKLGPLDRSAHEINAGVKLTASPGKILEIGIVENVSQYQNTPDIALHAGIEITI